VPPPDENVRSDTSPPGMGVGSRGAVPPWIFKRGTNIIDRGLKVLFFGLLLLLFGLFYYFFGLFYVGSPLEDANSAIFGIF